MTWPRLASVILASWALTTAGLAMLLGWWIVPTSAGLVLAAYAYPFARAMYVSGLAEKDEADR